MAQTLRFDGADWVRFATLASGLANVGDGAWTLAILIKRAGIGAFGALSYLTATGVVKAGASFNSGDVLLCDFATTAVSPTALTSTASPYLLVISKGGGSVAPTLSWKLGSAGAWTDETFNAAIADQVAVDALEIGTWQGGSDLLNAWVGLVGWWEGAMSATDKKTLDDNWRTSDWWNTSFGRPACLIECNVAAASLVDLAGNATNLSVTGTPTLESETLDNWNFDGTGAAAPPPATGGFQ